MSNPEFAAALIAGGKSRRMGRDKATLTHCGWRFWEVQVETLRELSHHHSPRYVVAPEKPDWIPSDFRWIPDHPEFPDCGPLAGFAALGLNIRASTCLVLGIDQPAVSPEILRKLLRSGRQGCGWIPETGGRLHPFAALYPSVMLVRALDHLRNNQYRVIEWVEAGLKAGDLLKIEVESRWQNEFLNLNTPEDYQKFKESHEPPFSK